MYVMWPHDKYLHITHINVYTTAKYLYNLKLPVILFFLIIISLHLQKQKKDGELSRSFRRLFFSEYPGHSIFFFYNLYGLCVRTTSNQIC